MNPDLTRLLKGKMAFPQPAGPGKAMSLFEAVRQFVRPQMSIQFGGNGNATPMAIVFEIARQYWGKDPRFTLIGIGGGVYNFALFIHGNLCRKIIAAFTGDGYPFPGPNAIINNALKEGSLELERWTQLTISLRLMAGAMGVPFFPTKSIAGSSLELENKDSFCRFADPFGTGESANVVKALNPDIALAHGWAADPDGNTLIAAPYSGNHYGALAAKEGVIVTVEKIVDTDFIRRHSYMTRIPGYVVRAVCEVPMGGHPMGLHNLGVPEMEGYAEDEVFIMEGRRASRHKDDYQKWVDKWVLGCRDQEEFLSRLGRERIWSLKGKIQNDTWISALTEKEGNLSEPEKPTPAEMLVYAATGKLQEIIRKKGYKLALCGIGVSNLAAWAAYYELRREGYLLELVAEIGYYGYSPQLSDPYVFNLRNIPSCSMVSDTFTALAIMMCGSRTSSIGVLGAGQIDRFGNVNSTLMSPAGPFLTGSGGANDVASGASESLVTLEQTKDRFVVDVPYVTSPGLNVTTIVSQLGILEKELGRNELELTAYFPAAGAKSAPAAEEESVRAIREQCGWNLKVRKPLQALPNPAAEDIKFLRCLDPQRLFLGDRKSRR
jgi:acyl CoA:acetate/3-ketoacid CoA transferase alpha subunit/acyl CoA:acetate/3-ketoacid CoA transferase beta subunit